MHHSKRGQIDVTYWHELVIPGIFTLIGAFLGAWLAGQKTIESVKEQIDYDRRKEKHVRIERHKKDVLIVQRYIDDLVEYAGQLHFFIGENETSRHKYGVPLVEEIIDLHKEILITKDCLDRIERDYLSLEIVHKIQGLLSSLTRIDLELNVYVKGIFVRDRQVFVSQITTILEGLHKQCDEITALLKE